MASRWFALAAALLAASPVQAAEKSGLPIPRFVTIKGDEANVRTGPGTRYPIQWVYRKNGLPVEVIEEFDLWRKIRDREGTTGWIYKTMLDGNRNALIAGEGTQTVRADAESAARAVLKVQPGVIAHLIECEPQWCRIQVSGRKGWIEKKFLWGVYPDEVFD